MQRTTRKGLEKPTIAPGIFTGHGDRYSSQRQHALMWQAPRKPAGHMRIATGCIVNNPGSVVAAQGRFPGGSDHRAEFLTGSTRMKEWYGAKDGAKYDLHYGDDTPGGVCDNRMVHMQISNDKLMDRGVKMLMDKLGMTDYATAKDCLLRYGGVQAAVENLKQ